MAGHLPTVYEKKKKFGRKKGPKWHIFGQYGQSFDTLFAPSFAFYWFCLMTQAHL
jgi:hypothetical protein